MNSSTKGEMSEHLAQLFWMSLGFAIFLPNSHSSPCDLVVEVGDTFRKVQVKTRRKCGKVDVAKKKVVSGSVVRTPYSPEDFDLLQVVDLKSPLQWVIPYSAIGEGTASISVVAGFSQHKVDTKWLSSHSLDSPERVKLREHMLSLKL